MLVLIVSLFLLYTLVGFLYSMRRLKEHSQVEHVRVSDSLVQEYVKLFPNYDSSMVTPGYAYVPTARSPFSTFDFKNGNCLIIAKLDTAITMTLRAAAIETGGRAEGSMDSIYNIINENYFEISHLVSKPKTIQNFYVTLNGDSIREITRNDSTIQYYWRAKNFSARYEQRGPVDIYGSVKGQEVPMDIFFMRRNGKLYFALLSVNNIDSLTLINPFTSSP